MMVQEREWILIVAHECDVYIYMYVYVIPNDVVVSIVLPFLPSLLPSGNSLASGSYMEPEFWRSWWNGSSRGLLKVEASGEL